MNLALQVPPLVAVSLTLVYTVQRQVLNVERSLLVVFNDFRNTLALSGLVFLTLIFVQSSIVVLMNRVWDLLQKLEVNYGQLQRSLTLLLENATGLLDLIDLVGDLASLKDQL